MRRRDLVRRRLPVVLHRQAPVRGCAWRRSPPTATTSTSRSCYRPFQLDPTAPPGTRAGRSRPTPGSSAGPSRPQAIIDRVTDTAAAEGLEFHLDRAQRANTLLAHRLLWLRRATASPGRAGRAEGAAARGLLHRRARTSAIPTCWPTSPPQLGLDRDDGAWQFLDSDDGVAEVADELRAGAKTPASPPCRRTSSTALGGPRRAGPRRCSSQVAAQASTSRAACRADDTRCRPPRRGTTARPRPRLHPDADARGDRWLAQASPADARGRGGRRARPRRLRPTCAPICGTGAALLASTGGRATYVGYSMGGRLRLHLAVARPTSSSGWC